jgi:hypothetical protein
MITNVLIGIIFLAVLASCYAGWKFLQGFKGGPSE